MWLEAEGPHKKWVNTLAMDTIYIQYKSGGRWGICGSIGTTDLLFKMCATEYEANLELNRIITLIKSK